MHVRVLLCLRAELTSGKYSFRQFAKRLRCNLRAQPDRRFWTASWPNLNFLG